jgi:hypothetical protein
MSYIQPPPYEYMSPPPSYAIGEVAGLINQENLSSIQSSSIGKELMKINEHMEPKEQNYYSTWSGVLAGISTFTILEIFRNFFF